MENRDGLVEIWPVLSLAEDWNPPEKGAGHVLLRHELLAAAEPAA